jgi:hypothetical protein
MNNAEMNFAFLEAIDADTRMAILDNIDAQYGCGRDAAFTEVTDEEAEPLLDYLTGPVQTATSALMQLMWRGPGAARPGA